MKFQFYLILFAVMLAALFLVARNETNTAVQKFVEVERVDLKDEAQPASDEQHRRTAGTHGGMADR